MTANSHEVCHTASQEILGRQNANVKKNSL